MNFSSLEKRIEILENEAKIIEKLAYELINSAPIIYYSGLRQHGFDSLPKRLIELQQQVITKYITWYNSVFPLIKKYLPHQLDEFKKRYQLERGGMFSYDITRILGLKVTVTSGNITNVIEKFRECFTFQKSQLLSLKNFVLDDTSEQLTTLNQLKECLVQNIYDYLLKNPTSFHAKTHSISKQKKNSVKERDNFICQICENEFPEEELEVDHILPYSLGGSNQITNLMTLCRSCNVDKSNSLDYYKSSEGKQKLLLNIREFTKDLLLIHNFGGWLKKVGDARRKKIALIAEKPMKYENIKGEQYQDDYITREKMRRPNTKLIETYLEFIYDLEISSENLYDRYRRIYLEVLKYSNLSEFKEEEKNVGVKIIQNICKNLLTRKERFLVNGFLEILHRLSIFDIFLEHLKSNCLNTFIQFYEDKNYYSFLIELLDNCGYFTNIGKEISRAIDNRNYDLLKKFENVIFSAYKREGIILVKILQSKQTEICDSEEFELKESIKKIIKNIENVMFFNK